MKLLGIPLSRTQIFLLCGSLILILALLSFRVVIGPIALSMVLAYLVNPTFTRLEARGWSRTTLTILLMATGFLISVVAIWVLFPILYAQLISLMGQLPQFRLYLETRALPALARFIGELVGDPQLKSRVFHLADLIPNSNGTTPDIIISGVGKSTQILFNTALGLTLTPFFTYYFIRYTHQFSKLFRSFIPRDLHSHMRPFVQRLDEKLRAVVRGQLLVIILLTTLYGTALGFSGMPFGFAVGVITGLVRIVPYLDLLVGGSLTFLILATSTPPTTVIVTVLLAFAAIQLLDIFLITPRIVGRATGIHPFIVILGILCFADWFGFFGVLLAIPLLAVGGVLLKSTVSVYKRSEFFRNKGKREPRSIEKVPTHIE
jgi:predicted PurR-regulated permease PerM